MKTHVDVDADTKLVHTVKATAANAADSKVLPDLLHGPETAVWGEAYKAQAKVLAEHVPEAEDTPADTGARSCTSGPRCASPTARKSKYAAASSTSSRP